MKRLILASLAMAALANCSKESIVDVAITSTQTPIEFTTYASSATTKGTPIDTNAAFQGTDNAFEVAAYLDEDGSATYETAAQKYFNFSKVTYGGSTSGWTNSNDMYWPNYDATLYFGATYPDGEVNATYAVATAIADETDNTHSLTFSYTVLPDVDSDGNLATAESPATTVGKVADHKDVMYAITEAEYVAETDGTTDAGTAEAVNLHFKHALTQIAFVAIKDADIDVTVSKIQLCNIMSGGSFTATTVTDSAVDTDTDEDAKNDTASDGTVVMSTAGSWGTTEGSIAHYVAALDLEEGKTGITVTSTESTSPTPLTDVDNALMLIPQKLTAWDATGDSEDDTTSAGTKSYLAITCKITHAAGTDDTMAPIIDGVVYVPFSTEGLDYDGDNTSSNEHGSTDDQWEPGYKITYLLVFGGGYVDPSDDPTDPTIPTPGDTPDPDDVINTLRAITYTTTVDAWETRGTVE